MKNKVIYFADRDISAGFRYRCKNICDALKSSEKWEAKYFFEKDFERAKKELKSANLLIISRQTDRFGFAKRLIRLARKQGITTVLDLDDYVFDPHLSKFIFENTGEKSLLYWHAYALCIKILARRVDKFCVTNSFLGEKLKSTFKKPYIVIPNFPSEEQFTFSESALTKKSKNENFTIGYFSGTRTHAKDFNIIEEEIISFLKSHEDTKLKIVGDFELTSKLSALKNQLITKPKVPFNELPAQIASVDVNLAPLALNDFTNSKSNLKFFEAALVKVPTLASPSVSFSETIEPGKTGFLCKKNEWKKTLENLYSNPVTDQKIAANAYNYCKTNYSGKVLYENLEGKLNELAK